MPSVPAVKRLSQKNCHLGELGLQSEAVSNKPKRSSRYICLDFVIHSITLLFCLFERGCPGIM